MGMGVRATQVQELGFVVLLLLLCRAVYTDMHRPSPKVSSPPYPALQRWYCSAASTAKTCT